MFNRARIYTVHVDPDLPNPYEKPIFIREGFNFAAFFLMGLWTLYHRLWLATLIIVIVEVALMRLEDAQLLYPTSITIMQLAFQILVGFHANDFRRAKLRRKGYIVADIATGENLLRAEQRFFERYLAAS